VKVAILQYSLIQHSFSPSGILAALSHNNSKETSLGRRTSSSRSCSRESAISSKMVGKAGMRVVEEEVEEGQEEFEKLRRVVRGEGRAVIGSRLEGEAIVVGGSGDVTSVGADG
jgi:hypothetical protein